MTKTNSILSMLMDGLKSAMKEKIAEAETEEEKEKVVEHFNSMDYSAILTDAFEKSIDIIFHGMKEAMYEHVVSFRSDEQAFIAHQEQKWYKAFAASEAMYIMTLEAAELYSQYVEELQEEEKKDRMWTFIALQHIHGRALQIFLEIITLMKNGFADGAYARWRSMYELSVVGSFIKSQGETIAKKYYESSETEDRYDWAKESSLFANRKRHISFNDIQKVCDFNTDDWKDQYTLANRVVHASPQGTFRRLCNTGTQSIIPVGRSDYGITTPGEHSAISLAVISAIFFTIFTESDTIASVGIINKWVDVIREAYFKTHDEVFPDDEKLWGRE